MSRCFTFPPPGYILNGIRDEAVIKSIKGAEEKAKKERRRKEKKREKKEKKRKEREGNEGDSEKRSHHKRQRKEGGDKDGQNQKVDVFNKSETECLEKSSLTVERELLHTTSQNSCDSTLNSNELPKQPLDGRHNDDSESIIRIRLRQKDPEVTMMANKDHQQKLSPSRRAKLDSSQCATRERSVNQHPCSTSAPERSSKPCAEKRKDRKHCKEKTPKTSQPSSLCSICPPSLAMQFLNVVENWVPNTIERRVELTNSENEECWWFSKKPSNHKFGTERCKRLNNETREISCSMAWPCARLLPEADVYALPYTVPF